jgi:hypothetical protein
MSDHFTHMNSMLDPGKLVTPGRFELPTRSLGNCCSIHLSYGATVLGEARMTQPYTL